MSEETMDEIDVDLAIEELLETGDFEIAGIGEDGEPQYRLTDKGKKRAEKLLGIDNKQ